MSNIYGYSNEVPPTESTLLSKIESSLENALDRLELEHRTSPVKRQKYIYIALQNFTEPEQNPITYSWFKWGASAIAGPGNTQTGQPLFVDPGDAEPLLETRLDEFEEYFVSGGHAMPLQEWWAADFLDFLEQFYQEYSPDEYRELYLANIQLLRILDGIQNAIYYGREPITGEDYQELSQVDRSIKTNVLAETSLESSYEFVKSFTNLLEDVAMVMVNLPSENIESGHDTAISELKDFYLDHVWLMVAHTMSLNSAKGPNAGKIFTHSESNLMRLRGEFDDKFDANKRICLEMDLLPSVEDYPDFEEEGGELEDKFGQFMGVVDGRISRE